MLEIWSLPYLFGLEFCTFYVYIIASQRCPNFMFDFFVFSLAPPRLRARARFLCPYIFPSAHKDINIARFRLVGP